MGPCRRISILMSYNCVSFMADIELDRGRRTFFEESLVAWSQIASCSDSFIYFGSVYHRIVMISKSEDLPVLDSRPTFRSPAFPSPKRHS